MSSLADTFEYYEKHVMQFRRNIHRAVFRPGSYRLTEKFRRFEIPPEAWIEKTPQETREHLMKFDKSVKTGHSTFTEASSAANSVVSKHQGNRTSQEMGQDGTCSQANSFHKSLSLVACLDDSQEHPENPVFHNESDATSYVNGAQLFHQCEIKE